MGRLRHLQRGDYVFVGGISLLLVGLLALMVFMERPTRAVPLVPA